MSESWILLRGIELDLAPETESIRATTETALRAASLPQEQGSEAGRLGLGFFAAYRRLSKGTLSAPCRPVRNDTRPVVHVLDVYAGDKGCEGTGTSGRRRGRGEAEVFCGMPATSKLSATKIEFDSFVRLRAMHLGTRSHTKLCSCVIAYLVICLFQS